ncbi:MAG: DUF177 domain-containing protein, partial [Hungatella sp.]
MLINLSELFTSEGKRKIYTLDIEVTQFQTPDGVYEVVEPEPLIMQVTNIGDRTLVLDGDARFSLMIPCGRCLEPVKTGFDFKIERTLDMKQSEEERIEDLDEQPYLNGYNLDVDQLVRDELLLNLPMKVLCDEDCKGICSRCGVNLNHE